MKTIILLFFYFFTTIIYCVDLPIMVEVRNKEIPSDFLDGVEEKLTSMNYLLVDKKTQEMALKEQAKQRNSDCYDDECLVDTGKMLAAKAIILIDVNNKNRYSVKFTARYIDLETGTTVKTTTKYFSQSLNNNEKLFLFGKDLIYFLFRNYKKDNTLTTKEDSRWSFSLGANFGLSIKDINVNDNTYSGAGIAMGGNVEIAYAVAIFEKEMILNLFTEVSYWSIGGGYNYNNGENNNLLITSSLINLNLGVEFIFGKALMELPLYFRTGIGNGFVSYKGTLNEISKYSFKTLGFVLEFGIDQKFFNNIFDIYIGTIINIYSYETGSNSIKSGGVETPIYMGIRHSF